MSVFSSQMQQDKRRHARHAVDLSGVAFFPSGSAHIRVIDLSFGGARIVFPMHSALYDARDVTSLRIADVLEQRVIWRWSNDRDVGVEFAAPDLVQGAVQRLIGGVSSDG